MTTYERVRYRRPGESGGRTLILRDPRVITVVDTEALSGVEVNREGDEVAPAGVDERRHIISLGLIAKRTPLVMDNLTALLVEERDLSEPTPDQSYCDLGRHQQCSGYTEDEADPETCMCTCHDPRRRRRT